MVAFGGGAFGRWAVHRRLERGGGISVSYRQEPSSHAPSLRLSPSPPLPPSPSGEDTGGGWPFESRELGSARNQPASTLIKDFAASRTVGNPCDVKAAPSTVFRYGSWAKILGVLPDVTPVLEICPLIPETLPSPGSHLTPEFPGAPLRLHIPNIIYFPWVVSLPFRHAVTDRSPCPG